MLIPLQPPWKLPSLPGIPPQRWLINQLWEKRQRKSAQKMSTGYSYLSATENDLPVLIKLAREVIQYNYSLFLGISLIQNFIKLYLCIILAHKMLHMLALIFLNLPLTG